jgi:hypothetical protein
MEKGPQTLIYYLACMPRRNRSSRLVARTSAIWAVVKPTALPIDGSFFPLLRTRDGAADKDAAPSGPARRDAAPGCCGDEGGRQRRTG